MKFPFKGGCSRDWSLKIIRSTIFINHFSVFNSYDLGFGIRIIKIAHAFSQRNTNRGWSYFRAPP